MIKPSDYVNKEYYDYSMYVLQSRAIPAVADGLKAAARRVLWIGKNGNKYKSATLAGLCMDIHPHAAPESTINTLAAPFNNNIPLLEGIGAFGTLMTPHAYGASRYTSVKLSEFTKKVLFKDIEIIPMMENYDGSTEEPKHFLPLIPTVLVNPSEGIAVGFATNILPRRISDIIAIQIAHLEGRKSRNKLIPYFSPTDSLAEVDEKSPNVFYFYGDYEETRSNVLTINKLPYRVTHAKFISKINELYENGTVIDIVDNSKDVISIEIKLKRGILSGKTKQEILEFLGLKTRAVENLNVLDFKLEHVWNVTSEDLVRKFTDWRLQWYIKRYERLRKIVLHELELYQDIKIVIDKNLGKYMTSIGTRFELVELLKQLKVVNIDYISNLPVYRFTQEEKEKNEKKIEEANNKLAEYDKLLASEDLRKKVYISELKEILKGKY